MLETYKHCKHQVGSTSTSGGISHLSMHVMAILKEALFDAARFQSAEAFPENEYANMPSTFKKPHVHQTLVDQTHKPLW